MKRLLYVDDDAAMLEKLSRHIRESFPGIETLTCQNSIQAIPLIDNSLDLLMIDLEMPAVDGKKLLMYATARGLDKKKIIIISGRDADYLHKAIPMGLCLCVLSKHEVRQMEVLDMVLAALEKK
ncbi:MAG: response regulator transcription factor [Nitrospirota bacterium]